MKQADLRTCPVMNEKVNKRFSSHDVGGEKRKRPSFRKVQLGNSFQRNLHTIIGLNCSEHISCRLSMLRCPTAFFLLPLNAKSSVNLDKEECFIRVMKHIRWRALQPLLYLRTPKLLPDWIYATIHFTSSLLIRREWCPYFSCRAR